MQLKHEHIVQLYDLIESEQSFYFVLELVDHYASSIMTVHDLLTQKLE